MAKSSYEIQVKSEAKRGVKSKSYKLHESTIANIELASTSMNIPLSKAIDDAIILYLNTHEIEIPETTKP